MKRVCRFSSDATTRAALLLLMQSHHNFHGFSNPKTTPSLATALSHHRNLNSVPNAYSDLIPLFTAKSCSSAKEDLINKASILKNELIRESSDSARVLSILDDNSDTLIQRHPDGSVLLRLMNQLNSNPSLALQVHFLSTQFKISCFFGFCLLLPNCMI